MKRTIRTLAAAAMAGAIAFSATPAADAQTTTEEFVNLLRDSLLEDLPPLVTDGNGHYYQLINTTYTPIELKPTEAEIAAMPVVTRTEGGGGVIAFKDGRADIVIPAPDANASAEVNPAGDAATQGEASAQGEAGAAGATGSSSNAGAAGNGEVDVDVEVAAQGSSTGAVGEGEAGLSTGAIAAIAAAAIGVPIVIAGVTYFLNQDGQTLVGSSDRVNQQPTPEEKAKSDQLRAEHADEIAAQQVAAAANRGVEAETGSNTIARTLFALVIASVLGAAAFVAGRRFLV